MASKSVEDSATTAKVRYVIVVPTYDERENVAVFCERVMDALPEGVLLFVDDNSPDGTGLLLEDLARQYEGRIHVIHRKRKSGLGAAYCTGFHDALARWPDAELLLQMDADLSHDPRYLPDFVAAAKNADVVVGSRYTHGISIVNWPLHRLIISKAGTAFARSVTGLPLTDCTSGFKCYRAEVLRHIDMSRIRSNGYVFQVETVFRAWRQEFCIREIPIIFHERCSGQSKLNLAIAFEAVLVVLRLGVERLLRRSTSRGRRLEKSELS